MLTRRKRDARILAMLLFSVAAPACAGPSKSPGQAMMDQQAAWETRTKHPPPSDVPDRCQSGDVGSDGPLGRPLERVRVRVMVDDRQAYESRTGSDGTFQVCLSKDRTVGLFGEGPYNERTARVRLLFDREGFEPAEMAFVFETSGGGPKRISMVLHRTVAP